MFNKILRFLYLNIYSLLLVMVGVVILLIPFYKINIWLIIIQIIATIKLLMIGGKLFSTWNDKKRMINILLSKNRKEFKPETFSEYMQAPCGRLVVKVVLKELGKSNEYKNLLKLKKPFWRNVRENCRPTKMVIYINETYINSIKKEDL